MTPMNSKYVPRQLKQISSMSESDGNLFRNDGSFLSTFLSKETTLPPRLESRSCSPPRVRRFHEERPSDSSRKRNRLSASQKEELDDSCSSTSRSKQGRTMDTLPMDPVERSLEAASHLKPFNTKEAKDRYEDALDTGGIIDGGTWEHRRRALEMVQTAELAETINSLHKEKTNVTSCIPLSVLEAFERSSAAVKAGKEPIEDVLGKQGPALDKANKGYKMLMKAGWKEGEGLGAEAEGITAPIPTKAQTVIGKTKGMTCEPTANDDQFELFRKRMMLAYRYRSNPLNNPRRSYDGYTTVYDCTN